MRLQVISPEPLPQATYYTANKVPYYFGTFGLLVRSHRRMKDKTQRQLSLAIGYTNVRGCQNLSNVERKLGTLPTKYFAKTAKYLGLPLRELYQAQLSDELITLELQVKHYSDLSDLGL